MIATLVINDGLEAALAPVLVLGLTGMVAWMVRTMLKVTHQLAKLDGRADNIDDALNEAATQDKHRDRKFDEHVAADAITAGQVARIEGFLGATGFGPGGR